MYVDHIVNDILSNMLSTSNKDVIIIIFILKHEHIFTLCILTLWKLIYFLMPGGK